jgi:transposase
MELSGEDPMIGPDVKAKILRLHHVEQWPPGTIARHLGLHHTTVRRVLVRAGIEEAAQSQRPSMIEPYLPFVRTILEKYPRLQASRLYAMVKERGYPGGPDHFRHLVALHRPKPPAEAYLRLRTLPGEQAQVDWGYFGKLRWGRAERPLMAFVMVLSWSRWIFLRFFLHQRLENFLRGHEAAFQSWEGVPRVVLYDNLKSAVLERRGDAIRFHPTLLEFAGHYRFEPRPVAVGRGNEKGRVERAIQYVRRSFFAARQWQDLDDLNAQAEQWAQTVAADRRCPEQRSLSVREAFEQERGQLLARPETLYPTDEREEVQVGKTPYVRFDRNDYSVPPTCVRRTLTVVADLDRVRIFDGNEVVATHARSFDRGEAIEDPAHLETLLQHKRKARLHRGMDRLYHAVPESQELLRRLAQRGANLGSATAALLRLLDTYGAAELESALDEALQKASPRAHDVRLVLERRQHQRRTPLPLPVPLPDDPRVRELVVRPHALDAYDPSHKESDDDDDDR